MRRPPPITELPSVPVTGAIGIAALAAMVGWAAGGDIERFVMDARTFQGEPWRIITSTLLHGDFIHLAFNLYWLWVFGTLVERTLGSLTMFGLFLFFSVTSGLAQWTFSAGGIGLSGVGYGLFGMLWVLNRYDHRFADAVDRPTIVLFVAWFFFCIVATITDLMRIGNVAHGAGWLAGSLCGLALVKDRIKRLAGWICAPLLLVLVLLGATMGRPFLNFSGSAGQDSAWAAYQALKDDRNEEALALYQEAVKLNPKKSSWWYNQGVAHSRIAAGSVMQEERIRHLKGAYRCYQRALANDPGAQDYLSAVQGTKSYLISQGWYDPSLEIAAD